MTHRRESTTPMRNGRPNATNADTLLGTYSVPAGGDEYRALENAHARHTEDAT